MEKHHLAKGERYANLSVPSQDQDIDAMASIFSGSLSDSDSPQSKDRQSAVADADMI
jgi:hypothetical protein